MAPVAATPAATWRNLRLVTNDNRSPAPATQRVLRGRARETSDLDCSGPRQLPISVPGLAPFSLCAASIVRLGVRMRFQLVASDYDGTLANDGRVAKGTLKVLERLQRSGRKLLLITGRELESLQSVFPELGLFDLIVAENGALLYRPSTREEKVLGSTPLPAFVEMLARSGANPLSVGRSIVATVQPYEAEVYNAIRQLGLNMQVIFNRESVMVLPAGVDKSTGFRAALAELGLPASGAVGIGDAENDYAFLSLCGFSVAVANAIPSLKERVDLVTSGEDGAGVVEVLKKLLTAEDSLEVAHPRP
jgi:hydroxymethylpyrimidine pyrophosphatase-like HAD family hydrolase